VRNQFTRTNKMMTMKKWIYPIVFLLACTGCVKDLKVGEPSFEVSTEKTTYAVGEPIEFIFEGFPGMITFFSGETFKEFAFREGRVLNGQNISLSFNSAVQFGTQENQMRVLMSSDFAGRTYSPAEVLAANWRDITPEFTLGTTTSYTPSGNLDITNRAEAGKPLYVAFEYLVKSQRDFGAARTWRVQNFNLTADTELGSLNLASMTTGGFRVVNEFVDSLTSRATITTTTLTLSSHVASNSDTAQARHWIITKPIDAKTIDLGPDFPQALKSNSDDVLTGFTFPGYPQPGTYKATFVAVNGNVYGRKEVIREITLTITP